MTPAAFYIGAVSHQRFAGPSHRLRYRLAYVLVDLDRLPEAGRLSRFFGAGCSGVMSVRSCDHGDGENEDLAGWVRRYLKDRGVANECARIELLTLPRMFGFVFNPISVYFIYDGAGALHHILYEVNNTFGDRTFYLAECGRENEARHSCDKQLYVSPFFDVEGRYSFAVAPPGQSVVVSIRYDDAGGRKALTAHLAAKRAEITDWRCLKVLFGFPLMTIGVVAAIHWEALKLFVKGARYRPPAKAGAG